ncbi:MULTISPECIES: hypothetical protein [Pseudomonas]|uniref:hypothetical protein n=1 Tax=Pseudomonas TaxID=286 RepID=UPI00236103C9|nr:MULTISPECIES: hypothetical protein [Pseudomonas]WJV25799.1 hypothetical protein PSR66_07165 [Pseudomonas chlororaphis]
MKRALLSLIVLCTLLLGGFVLLKQSQDRATSRTHASLLQLVDKNVDYQPLIAGLNEIRSAWQNDAPLCVNTAFKQECTNILILDLSVVEKITNQTELKLLKNLRNNAITLPPNLILIDRHLISSLIFETYNLTLATARAVAQREGSIADLATEFSVASVANSEVIRSNHVPTLFFGSDANDSDINAFSSSLLDFKNKTNEDDAIQDNIDGMQKVIFELSLALLLEHEVAHLQVGSGVFGLNTLLGTASEIGANLTLNEENRADQVAIVAMNHYVDALKKSNNQSVSRFLSDPVGSSLPSLVQAEYFRDSELMAGLENFRGFKADDLAIEISHQTCGEESENRNFFDPLTILAARRKPLPILTADEWNERRIVFAHSDIPQTHLHNLIRAENIYTALDQLAGKTLTPLKLNNHVAFVKALLSDTPKTAFPSSDGFKVMKGTMMDNFIKGTQGYVTYTPAVTCPLSRCYVGSIENSDGYIELIGSDKEVSELRLVMNLGDGLGRSEEQDHKYLENMLKYMNTMAAISAKNSSAVSDYAAELRRGKFKCGAASTLLVDKATGIAYHSTTLQRPGFIQVRIFNAETMDEE